MGIEQIQDSLKIIIGRLKKKYNPERVILFGSYAKDIADEASDVDILVVSEVFKNRDAYDVYSELYELVDDFDKDIQLFGVSENNISQYKTLSQAVREGKIIYSN
jgi:predicted nucleotidyltransferase